MIFTPYTVTINRSPVVFQYEIAGRAGVRPPMRLEVTRRAELAVRAIGELAAGEARIKAGDLATSLATTTGFVAHVLSPLVKAGWVRSDPGPAGGYRLREEARGLSVLDIIEAVDGPTDDGRCVVEDRPCTPTDRCVMHSAWQRARSELRAGLAAMPAASWSSPTPPT